MLSKVRNFAGHAAKHNKFSAYTPSGSRKPFGVWAALTPCEGLYGRRLLVAVFKNLRVREALLTENHVFPGRHTIRSCVCACFFFFKSSLQVSGAIHEVYVRITRRQQYCCDRSYLVGHIGRSNYSSSCVQSATAVLLVLVVRKTWCQVKKDDNSCISRASSLKG